MRRWAPLLAALLLAACGGPDMAALRVRQHEIQWALAEKEPHHRWMTSPAGERDEPQQWQHETHPDYLERMRGASDLKREILALRSELRDVERQIAEAGQKP